MVIGNQGHHFIFSLISYFSQTHSDCVTKRKVDNTLLIIIILLETLEIHLQKTITVMKISIHFTNYLCFPLSTSYSL